MICSVIDCTTNTRSPAATLCDKHYMRLYRHGHTGLLHRKIPTEQRFWSKVNKNGTLWANTHCWEWTGAKVRGYGHFWDGERFMVAHRYSYETLIGAVPKGLEIDHLCRNRACVNPKHMEPVNRLTNFLRGEGPKWAYLLGQLGKARQQAKTHCPQGHPYIPGNTYYSRKGHRRCRICTLDSNKASQKRRLKT